MNSLQLTDEKVQLRNRCQEIVDACKAEIREMTDDEKNEFEANKQRIIELNDELEKLKKELENYDAQVPTDNEDVSKNPQENNRNLNENKMEKKEFRLIKAINDVANNRNLDDNALEINRIGTEEMRKAGLSFGGQIQLPTSELRAAVTVTAEHDNVIETEMFDILEPLRAKNVLVLAGAKFLTGLVGDIQVPSFSGNQVFWEGENVAAKDGAGTFSNVKMQPKRLTAYVDVSKQFLVQDSLSAENLIRQDLINALNSKLEATILGEGKGNANEPAGIFAEVTGATTITDFKGICDLEASLEDANINGEAKYVMSNKAKAHFRNMAKSAKSTELVYQNGTIDGTPVLNTSHVGANNLAYGDFSNLAIGQWGGIDLTVDPFSKATEGMVRLVINAYFDAKVLRPEGIKVAKIA